MSASFRPTVSWFLYTLLFGVLTFSAFGCARTLPKDRSDSMRPSESGVSNLHDDLPAESLIAAIEEQVVWWERSAAPDPIQFGPRRVKKAAYLSAMRGLLDAARKNPKSLSHYVDEHFDAYEVFGDPTWGEVFITSYFEPVLEGSKTPTDRFWQPLYKTPDDLLTIELSQFAEKYADASAIRGRLQGKKVVPYYGRSDIDGKNILAQKNLELCYVDPIDAFFLHIQGSGTVHFADGEEMRLGYAEKNGRKYEAVGKFLKDKISGGITLRSIEAHLRTLDKSALLSVLNMNPSYVFFSPATKHATTSIGLAATAGRTIATDRTFFPKGTLAILEFDAPLGGSRTEHVSRIVLDQDVGGAITGPGRVDLFWGRGREAGLLAGDVKTRGTLRYLVPKGAS